MAKVPGVPAPMGTPAESQGPVDSDNIGPLDAKTRSGQSGLPLSEGPQRGERNSFLPARYVLKPEVVMTADGPVTVSGVICEDH